MSNLRDARLPVRCPLCGSVFSVAGRQWIGEQTVLCPCGHHVHLVDGNDGLRKLDRDIDRQVQHLNRTIRRINQQLRRHR